MDIETLNSLYSHAGYVTFKEGPNGFPIALITTPHATAAITPYGAHLLSYQFAFDNKDLLFLSEKAIFKEGTPIRGGVPICWPWFGPDPQALGRSDHGFARTTLWSVISTDLLPNHECSITFELSDTSHTMALWPHHFSLRLKLTVGSTLSLELTTHNRGDSPMEITQALHTYFAVGDISTTTITGLEGFSYCDKTDESRIKDQSEAIQIVQEVDRIYPYDGGEITLHDATLNRTIHINNEGSKTAVVWNPWIRICEQKADLESDNYQKMVCIETANIVEDIIILQRDQSFTLKASYTL